MYVSQIFEIPNLKLEFILKIVNFFLIQKVIEVPGPYQCKQNDVL